MRARSKQIGALGFREVESAGYYNHTAAQVKQAMSGARLHLVSAHYSSDDLHQKLDQVVAFSKERRCQLHHLFFPRVQRPFGVKKH